LGRLMSGFKNLKTRSKLLTAFGLILVLMAIAIATAYFGITRLRDSEQGLFSRDFIIVTDLIELKALLNRQRADIEQMQLTTDRAAQERIERDIRDRSDAGDSIAQRLIEF